jgi:Xaa-Pro aminopeptidase
MVGGKTVAMEISPRDGVPYLDRIPSGVVQLVESSGARIVGSGPLVTRFAATWSESELAGHRRAAEALAVIANEALRWAGAEMARGAEVREVMVQRRVLEAMGRAGLVTNDPPIAAFQQNAALPHYEPRPGSDRRLASGDVMLLDLWGGPTLGTVFADQTWMAFAGKSPDAEVRKVWEAVRGARDAAIALLQSKQSLTGAEVDDAARAVIRGAGYGEFFVHRTGHSIDKDLHGSGPHIDNYETNDDRRLVPGIGFSIEPGIYMKGRFGMRSEVNVHMGMDGPEVTPSKIQTDLWLV